MKPFQFHLRCVAAFTLIELLIVVGIIAILAAIAIPNMLAAQVRAKLSRVRADQRTIATALETYYVDNNSYVVGSFLMAELGIPSSGSANDQFVRWRLRPLTTPIAYVTSLPPTPFSPTAYTSSSRSIALTQNLGAEYDTCRSPTSGTWYNNVGPMIAGSSVYGTQWHLRDAGPDNIFGNSAEGLDNLYGYDATNGTTSNGDVWRFGP